MNNKTFYNLLRTMFFNASYYQLNAPGLLIGRRCFKIDFSINDGSGIVIRNYDNYLNQQTIYFNTRIMRIESMTEYSEMESNIHLIGLMHSVVVPKKARSDFETRRMFNQFNLYVQYIIFLFNYMYWR